MGMIVTFSIVFAFFIRFDLIPLYRDKEWKSFWFYSITLSISYIIFVLIALGLKIPSPAVPLAKLVDTVVKMF